MSRQAEVNPNVPDIAPDYVDLDTAGRDMPQPREADGNDAARSLSLEPALLLNSEIVRPPAGPGVSPEERDGHAATPEAGNEASIEDTLDNEQTVAAGFRQGECIPNTPDAAPQYVAESTIAAKTAGAVEAEPEPASRARRSWLRWDVVATVLILSLFGLLVFGQAISALSTASAFPAWMQYALLIPMGVFCLGILLFCFSVIRAWFRLRAVRQIDVEALEELRRRAQTRKDGIEHFQAARGELENYLNKYLLDADGVRRLREAGVAEEVPGKLLREREYLLGRTTDSRSWLDEFRAHFQSELDKSARGRIRQWSLAAAGCVIASPIPLLDAALVLGVAMKMIRDLCHIYNVRSSRASTLVLLNRAILAAFVAGLADDAATMATDAAGDELVNIFGETAMGSAGAGLARIVAPKLGEGAINAFFINRLGKATVRMLQPLKPQK